MLNRNRDLEGRVSAFGRRKEAENGDSGDVRFPRIDCIVLGNRPRSVTLHEQNYRNWGKAADLPSTLVQDRLMKNDTFPMLNYPNSVTNRLEMSLRWRSFGVL